MGTPLHIRGKDFLLQLISVQNQFGRCLSFKDMIAVEDFKELIGILVFLPEYDDSSFSTVWAEHYRDIKHMLPPHSVTGSEYFLRVFTELTDEVERQTILWNSLAHALHN